MSSTETKVGKKISIATNSPVSEPQLTPSPEVDKNRPFAIWFDKDKLFITSAITAGDNAVFETTMDLSFYVQTNKGYIKEIRYAEVGCAFMGKDCNSPHNKVYDANTKLQLKLFSDFSLESKRAKIMHAGWRGGEIKSRGAEKDIQYLESNYGVSALIFQFEDSEGNILMPRPEVLVNKPSVEPDPLYSIIARYKDGRMFYSFPCSPKGDICTKEWRVIKDCPRQTPNNPSSGPSVDCTTTAEEISIDNYIIHLKIEYGR